MSYTTVIFDLDGTLTNSKEGIINSLGYALSELNIDDYDEKKLEKFIGPPLQVSFKELFNMNEAEVSNAVMLFREYYSQRGLYENEPYPGIIDLLCELHNYGRKVFVATSKLEKYAKIVLDYFGMNQYIDDLKGADYGGSGADKDKLITYLINKHKLTDTSGVVMIGDTHFDMTGAIETDIDKIAVGYGFGTKEELLQYNPEHYAETVEELHDILLS